MVSTTQRKVSHEIGFLITDMEVIVDDNGSCFGAVEHEAYQSMARRKMGVWKLRVFKYSWLENAMDRGAWQAAILGVAKESDKT